MPLLEHAEELPTIDAGPFAFRMIRPADAEDLFAIFGDPQVTRFWSSSALDDLVGARNLAADIRRGFDTRTLFQWGLVLPEDDRVIGTGTLCGFDQAHRRCEVGYALVRSEWGRGVMSRVLPALIGFGFEALDLHRIEADVDPRNPASYRLLERLGFQREGCRRESYFVGGEIQDAIVYGLLRREFKHDTIPME